MVLVVIVDDGSVVERRVNRSPFDVFAFTGNDDARKRNEGDVEMVRGRACDEADVQDHSKRRRSLQRHSNNNASIVRA